MEETLTALEYMILFGYLFLPILIFGIGVYVSIILSNRMGGKNKLITFFVRVILVGGLVVALAYYFLYFLTVVLMGG